MRAPEMRNDPEAGVMVTTELRVVTFVVSSNRARSRAVERARLGPCASENVARTC